MVRAVVSPRLVVDDHDGLLSPIFFLLSIGVLPGNVVDDYNPNLGGLTYLEFVAPGLIAALAMQIGTNEGSFPVMASLVWVRTFHAVVATPVRVASWSVDSCPGPPHACSSPRRCSQSSLGSRLLVSARRPHTVRCHALRPRVRRADGCAGGADQEPQCPDGGVPLAILPIFLFSGRSSRSASSRRGCSRSRGRRPSGTASRSVAISAPGLSTRWHDRARRVPDGVRRSLAPCSPSGFVSQTLNG